MTGAGRRGRKPPARVRCDRCWLSSCLLATVLLVPVSASATGAVDHRPWSALLQRCVTATPDGASTAVDYGCFAEQRPSLTSYLDALGAVERDEFSGWTPDAQLAFLINAYNAWTVELILTAWPDLDSIRDLGGFLTSPWEKSFIPLLGGTRTLDEIEHGMIREPGRFDEPRIHFAVNCASIGCPGLHNSDYDFPDAIIETGVSMYWSIIQKALEADSN